MQINIESGLSYQEIPVGLIVFILSVSNIDEVNSRLVNKTYKSYKHLLAHPFEGGIYRYIKRKLTQHETEKISIIACRIEQ